jgi:hypothetical protein
MRPYTVLGTLAVCLSLGVALAAGARTGTSLAGQKGTSMSGRASGTFEVAMKALPNDQKVEGLEVGRHSIAKEFKGDLVGTSKGEMTGVGTSVEGSAGYVAVEQVSGTLKGRTGTFLLLHQGTMQRGGDFKLSIVVVPDSGTAQLTGLAGRMTIIIAGGSHSYDFDYTLPSIP